MAGRASAGDRGSGLPEAGWSAAQTILPGKPFTAPAGLGAGSPAASAPVEADPVEEIVPGFAAIEQAALIGAGAAFGEPVGLPAGFAGLPSPSVAAPPAFPAPVAAVADVPVMAASAPVVHTPVVYAPVVHAPVVPPPDAAFDAVPVAAPTPGPVSVPTPEPVSVPVAAPFVSVRAAAAPYASVPVAFPAPSAPPVGVLPRSAPPSVPLPSEPPSVPPPSEMPADVDGVEGVEGAAAGSRKVSPVLLVLLLVLVAVGGGGYYWFFLRGASDSAPQTISVPLPPVHHTVHTVGTPPAALAGYSQVHGAAVDKLVSHFGAPLVQAGYTHVVGAAYQNPKNANSRFVVLATDGIPAGSGDAAAGFVTKFAAYEKAAGRTVSTPVSAPAGAMGGTVTCGSISGPDPLSYCVWYDHSTLGMVVAPGTAARALAPAARTALEN